MTPSDPSAIRRDLEPGIDEAEIDGLVRIAARLEAERPVPSAAFRGELCRKLFGAKGASLQRPPRLRLLIFSYASSGFALLLVAAIGVAGAGPFASG